MCEGSGRTGKAGVRRAVSVQQDRRGRIAEEDHGLQQQTDRHGVER